MKFMHVVAIALATTILFAASQLIYAQGMKESLLRKQATQSARSVTTRPMRQMTEEELVQAEQKLSVDNLAEFRKKQLEEYQEKAKTIRQQQQNCSTNVEALRKKRQEERQQLRSTCLPKIATPSATLRPDLSAYSAQERAQYYREQAELKSMQAKARTEQINSCTNQLKEFDLETRKQVVALRQSCVNAQRTVLGLSTEAL